MSRGHRDDVGFREARAVSKKYRRECSGIVIRDELVISGRQDQRVLADGVRHCEAASSSGKVVGGDDESRSHSAAAEDETGDHPAALQSEIDGDALR